MPNDFCEFKSLPRDKWRFGASNKNRKLAQPTYGAGLTTFSQERAIKRCPLCLKRLRLRADYCIGGEFASWRIPDHKPRVTRSKSLGRKPVRQRRGS